MAAFSQPLGDVIENMILIFAKTFNKALFSSDRSSYSEGGYI